MHAVSCFSGLNAYSSSPQALHSAHLWDHKQRLPCCIESAARSIKDLRTDPCLPAVQRVQDGCAYQ